MWLHPYEPTPCSYFFVNCINYHVTPLFPRLSGLLIDFPETWKEAKDHTAHSGFAAFKPFWINHILCM